MKLSDQIFETLNIMICELKENRSYGTKHNLSYSDISFLKCVERNENSNASILSNLLGMTNGAVTQLAKKLINKNLIEVYHLAGNNKEVYYKLTSQGALACKGFDNYFNKTKSAIDKYFENKDNKTKEAILGLFDSIKHSVRIDKCCYIKNDEDSVRRCEKCKRSY